MGRVSKEDAAKNRTKVVEIASSLFRRKGLDVGIDEIMAEAGLTRGGFYGQFDSKDDLAGEACVHAFESSEEALREASDGDSARRLYRLVKFYFAPKPPGFGCPMASLANDAARAPSGSPFRQAFTVGLKKMVALVAGKKPDDAGLAVMAAMVGAAVLRQATDDAALAKKIEAAVLHLALEHDTKASRT